MTPTDPIMEARPTEDTPPTKGPMDPTGYASYLLDVLTHGTGWEAERKMNLILATRQFTAAMDQTWNEGYKQGVDDCGGDIGNSERRSPYCPTT